jgi:hypothetical protein
VHTLPDTQPAYPRLVRRLRSWHAGHRTHLAHTPGTKPIRIVIRTPPVPPDGERTDCEFATFGDTPTAVWWFADATLFDLFSGDLPCIEGSDNPPAVWWFRRYGTHKSRYLRLPNVTESRFLVWNLVQRSRLAIRTVVTPYGGYLKESCCHPVNPPGLRRFLSDFVFGRPLAIFPGLHTLQRTPRVEGPYPAALVRLCESRDTHPIHSSQSRRPRAIMGRNSPPEYNVVYARCVTHRYPRAVWWFGGGRVWVVTMRGRVCVYF